jgi:secondary thiamine-phosphate synthase enzyme
MLVKVSSTAKRQIVDITDLIEEKLEGSGLVNVFIKHTTAAITLADLDPGTDQDILDAFAYMTPKKQWRHPHNPSHFPDHLWSSIIGPSLLIPYNGAKLQIGTWQRVIVVELDGPKDRQIELSFIKL